jgi:hypothetical protein
LLLAFRGSGQGEEREQDQQNSERRENRRDPMTSYDHAKRLLYIEGKDKERERREGPEERIRRCGGW